MKTKNSIILRILAIVGISFSLSSFAQTGSANAQKIADGGKVVSDVTHYFYQIEIDCYDPDVDYADTEDTITVSFEDPNGNSLGVDDTSFGSIGGANGGDGLLVFSYPDCGFTDDAVYRSDIYEGESSPHPLVAAGFVFGPRYTGVASVFIETSGQNALWMDEIYLYVMTKRVRTYGAGNTQTDYERGALIGHWGRDGGLGYCLSTDFNDGSGEWADYVDTGCYKKFRFDVSTPETNQAYSYR